MNRLISTFLISLFTLGSVFAQISVEGTVTGDDGLPLEGVYILENGKSNGEITDASGEYSISVDSEATLIFTLMGYAPQEVEVAGRKILDVQMEGQDLALEEVVVIGYQTLRKSDLTGAVSNINASDLNLTTPTLGQALTGKIAGVQVSQISGAPYETTKIRVRGIGSINASSEPL